MRGKSINGKSIPEINIAFHHAVADGFKPTLAIVFLSQVEEIDAITALLDAKNITVFGASTSEKFSEEGIEPDGIVVLLLDMNPAHFKVKLHEYHSETAHEAASEVGIEGKNTFDDPAFIIASADISTPAQEVISGLLCGAGDAVTIAGGITGSHTPPFSGTLFTNRQSTHSGLMALILDEGKIHMKAAAVSGWKPVGTVKKFTKCKGNTVYTIDDEPALQVIKKFLGTDMLTSTKSDGLDSYPLQCQREGRKPVMNPVIQWNKDDQSIVLGAPVIEGSAFRFSLPPDLEVIETVIASTQAVKQNELPEADALLVFSCVGRLSSLGPMIAAEIEGIAGVWNKPMVGLFSLGEYGKLDDSLPEFHGTTVSWVALKEK